MKKKENNRYVDPNEQFVVHPDMLEAFENYDGTGNSFRNVFKKRDEKVANGEPFWNTDHDEEMRQTAEERSRNPLFRWPTKKR